MERVDLSKVEFTPALRSCVQAATAHLYEVVPVQETPQKIILALAPITIAAILIGCSIEPKSVRTAKPVTNADRASDISFPTTTEFDDDAEARAAYMAGFENGYRAALRGSYGLIDTMGRAGRRGFAKEIGYMAGQLAAQQYMSKRNIERALEQKRRLQEENRK